MTKTMIGGAAVMVLLTACTTGQSAQMALVTCSSEATAISILADLKHAGKLSTGTMAIVDQDLAVVSPVCEAASPSAAITGVANMAAAELISLAGGLQ